MDSTNVNRTALDCSVNQLKENKHFTIESNSFAEKTRHWSLFPSCLPILSNSLLVFTNHSKYFIMKNTRKFFNVTPLMMISTQCLTIFLHLHYDHQSSLGHLDNASKAALMFISAKFSIPSRLHQRLPHILESVVRQRLMKHNRFIRSEKFPREQTSANSGLTKRRHKIIKS